MNEKRIHELIKKGEGVSIEFKECRAGINKDLYETVCSFLNRQGGEILLGVKDNGQINGVDQNCLAKIKDDFVTAVNNPQKINPAFYLSIEEINIEGKTLLYIFVPESSQVHRCNGIIYDRNEDGDFNITDNTNLVSALYIRKQTNYSENKVYPFITMDEFRSDLIQKVRKIVTVQNQNHPWASLTDEELLKSARLYQQDFQTGKYGFTLASVLLLGKDDVILSVVPHHRTDAILRRMNTDRYDDRDFITTNLIESYDRLMVFVEKHLPDPFYMEGTSRISIRAHIFREIIVNSLIHREYLNAYPARLIIEADQISLENSNRPHGYGLINLRNSIPFPKNPIIASFFRQINLAEELGSGFKKLAKYGQFYFGAKPIVQEKDIFRFEAPYPNAVRDQRRVAAAGAESGAESGVESGVESEIAYKILILLQKATFGKKEIAQKLGKEKPSRYLNELTAELLTNGFIEYVIPGKPNSRLQRYRITAKGKAVVDGRKENSKCGHAGENHI